MALQITRYGASTSDAVYGSSGIMSVLGPAVGDREDLAVSGTHAPTAAFVTGQIVRLYPQEKCVIRIGVGATATAATGETIDPSPDGVIRYVPAGARISVIAP